MNETLVTDEILEKAYRIWFATTGDAVLALHAALSAVVDDLVRAEREACELIALRERDKWRSEAAEEIAGAIRSRG